MRYWLIAAISMFASHSVLSAIPDANIDAEAVNTISPQAMTGDAGPSGLGLDPVLEVEAQLQPQRVKLGETFWLKIKIRRLQGQLLQLPDEIGNTEVQQRGEIVRQQHSEQGVIVETLEIPLVALALDDVRSPAFRIALGHDDTVEIAGIPMQVDGLLDEQAKPAQEAPPLDVLRSDRRPLWLLLGSALAIIVFFAWRRWRRQRPQKSSRPAPPPRPAHEVALEQLLALERSEHIARGDFSQFVDEASDIFRWYLGARYGFSGLDRTSSELLEALKKILDPQLDPSHIRAILDTADLVKFAKAHSDAQHCAKLLSQIREVISLTKAVSQSTTVSDPP